MTHRTLSSVTVFGSAIQRLTCSFSTRCNDHIKNIAQPEKIPVEYWDSILTSAQNLKKKIQRSNKECLKLLNTKHVTLLFIKPHGRFQVAYTLACDLLGTRRTLICDSHFEKHPNPGDGGRVLSKLTDLLVTHGLHHEVLIQTVSSCDIPVLSASSDVHCLQKAVSDLMTFYERFGSLKGLNVAWIGPPNALFNSYMLLCSKFEVNFRYFLTCRYGTGRMSPVKPLNLKGIVNETNMLEFKDIQEAIKGAHVVATSMHADETSTITLELLKEADPNCVFMHSLPRGWKEVSTDVFNSDKNLSWVTSDNYLYVAMAFILTALE